MGLKIAYLMLVATPLMGVIIAFMVPLVLGGFGPHKDHFKAGQNWYTQRQYEKAIEEFSKAVEAKPDFAEAYVKRGQAWYAIGNWVQALWDYNEALTYEKQLILKMATREYQDSNPPWLRPISDAPLFTRPRVIVSRQKLKQPGRRRWVTIPC